MSEPQAICIVVDGLRASALGTYGNTTSATPRLDRFASRSTVVEWLWADSPQLDDFHRAVWEGANALRPGSAPRSNSVLDILGEAGIERRFIVDDEELAEQPSPARFDKVVSVETAANCFADDISDTAMGQFCSAVIERLENWGEQETGALTWIHTRGLFGAWDAPADVRAEHLDEDDPPPAQFLVPPTAMRNVEDPDVVLVHRAAYAAQVAVVDACLGALCQAIEELAAGTDTLVMLLGSRGFALGEHGSIGTECCDLYGERLHLPWLRHVCGQKIPQPRLQGLAQPADVGTMLLEWFRIGDHFKSRQVAVSAGANGERAIRTPAWFMRQPSADGRPQLFAKPDDRWEANDIAVRCPQVVEQLQTVLAEYAKGAPITLEQELVNPSR